VWEGVRGKKLLAIRNRIKSLVQTSRFKQTENMTVGRRQQTADNRQQTAVGAKNTLAEHGCDEGDADAGLHLERKGSLKVRNKMSGKESRQPAGQSLTRVAIDQWRVACPTECHGIGPNLQWPLLVLNCVAYVSG
jgi:hypothetical protein